MLGSHLSVSGGMVNALREAKRLKMDCVQVFTANQRQWNPKSPTADEQREWLGELRAMNWDSHVSGGPIRVVSHNSYLINLGSPDAALRKKSIAAMRDEIERCEALHIPLTVAHPGAHLGTPRKPRTPNDLSGAINDDERGGLERIAYCFDTCHVTAAGYDMTTPDRANAVMQQWDDICGISNLRVFHFNDSQGEVGSRLDRHEHIGDGRCGKACFAFLMNFYAFATVPKILETPKDEDDRGREWDAVNMQRLRRMRNARKRSPAKPAQVARAGRR